MKTITIPLFGGLGNQMFQVAHALDLTQQTGTEPCFVDLSDISGRVVREWGLDCFGIPREWKTRQQRRFLKAKIVAAARLQKLSPKLIPSVLLENNEVQVKDLYAAPKICSGFWQGERYFNEATQRVKETFTFPDVQNVPPGLDFDSAQQTVAVHVRRGDYVTDPIAHAYHFVCGENWYLNAIQQMRNSVPDAIFYVFSDDPDWAKLKFGALNGVSIVTSGHDAPTWVDMALMSRCRHFIISNSTYSWWASYLGKSDGSVIIAPKYWSKCKPTEEKAVYCSDWTLL